MVMEPERKKIKSHTGETEPDEKDDDYVLDVYHMEEGAQDDVLDSHPTVFFLESVNFDFGELQGPEYDDDIDSEDSNAECHAGNSYPDELSSSDGEYQSSDASDHAYFSDYDDYGELDY